MNLSYPPLLTDSGGDYAVPDVTKSALVVALPPQVPQQGPPQPPIRTTPTLKSVGGTPAVMTSSLDKPPTYDALYAAADIVNQMPNLQGVSLQGVSGNNVYAVPNAELLLTLELNVVQFPRENLQFIEVLGEGQFGEVSMICCYTPIVSNIACGGGHHS